MEAELLTACNYYCSGLRNRGLLFEVAGQALAHILVEDKIDCIVGTLGVSLERSLTDTSKVRQPGDEERGKCTSSHLDTTNCAVVLKTCKTPMDDTAWGT